MALTSFPIFVIDVTGIAIFYGCNYGQTQTYCWEHDVNENQFESLPALCNAIRFLSVYDRMGSSDTIVVLCKLTKKQQ